MQVLHLRIFAGIVTAGTLATGLGVASLSSGRAEAEKRLARVEVDIAAARKADAAAGASRRTGGRDLEAENAMLGERVRTFEARVAILERENAMLKERIAAAAGAPSADAPAAAAAPPPAPPAARPTSGGSGGLLAGRPAAGPGLGTLPPAGMTPHPGGDGGGEAPAVGDQGELADLAKALRLVPEQRDELRKIYREQQDDHDRLLVEANASGERDITSLERIGEEVRKKFHQRVTQMLYAEQRPLFDEWKRKKADAPK